MILILTLILAIGIGVLFFLAFREEEQKPVSLKETKARAEERAKEKGRKPTPLTGACSLCKKKVSLPFRCKFCGELFCVEHRLPEDHKCDAV